MFFRFAFLNVALVVSFLRRRLEVGFPKNVGQASVMSSDLVGAFSAEGLGQYTKEFFSATGIRMSQSVPYTFANDLFKEHHSAYRDFLERVSLSGVDANFLKGAFDNQSTNCSEGVAKISESLDKIKDGSNDSQRALANEVALAFRYSLIVEILKHYMFTNQIKKLLDTSYRKMIHNLQFDPFFFPLALSARVAVARSEGRNVDQMLEDKGNDLQKFGCFFWVLC
jgi:hypothetical protein